MRIVFAAKNYISGQNVNFKIYDENQNIIFDELGTEWGTTGNYYIDVSLDPTKLYLIVAEENSGSWKASRYIIGGVDIGDYITQQNYYKEDNSLTAIATTTFQDKLSFNTTSDNIINGNYILNWQIEIYNNTKDGGANIRLIDNQNTFYAEHLEIFSINNLGTGKIISGFSTVIFNETINTYKLQIAQHTKGTAYFRNARMRLSQ